MAMKTMSDKEMALFVTRKDNLPILEHLLETKGNELKSLKSGTLDFGADVKDEEIEGLFEDVKHYVDGLLSSSDVKKPVVYQDTILNGYISEFKAIPVEKGNLAKTLKVLAHEYAHHVQNMRFGEQVFDESLAFAEGHAIGVERAVMEQYALAKNNEAFRQGSLERTYGHLKSIYRMACSINGINENKDLMFADEKETESACSPFGGILPHVLGDAFFCINESVQGKHIYANALQKK